MRKITNRAWWLPAWTILLFAFAGVASFAGPNDDIFAASKAGDRVGVEAALTGGASVNARDKDQTTPLGLAAIYGHKNVATLLIDRGANIETRDEILGQTPLHLAASNGNTDVVELLLNRGANVNVRDANNATPLDWAAFFGRKNTVARLLARGALVNARDVNGATPLHYAAFNGQGEIATLLLAHGADPMSVTATAKRHFKQCKPRHWTTPQRRVSLRPCKPRQRQGRKRRHPFLYPVRCRPRPQLPRLQLNQQRRAVGTWEGLRGW
jgi:Ankyrin repeats (3 copies)/Ankyrin repeats (many copies)